MARPVDKVVAREVKDQLKAFLAVLLGAVLALGITLGAGVALANGEHEENDEHEASEFEVTLSSNPRFPVVGEEAELTFTVSHVGTHEEGLTGGGNLSPVAWPGW